MFWLLTVLHSAKTLKRLTNPVSVVKGVTDSRLKNQNELKKRITSVLKGFDNVDSIVKKAQISNMNIVKFKFGPSDISFRNGNEFYRTFTLTSVFVRSMKNSNGTYTLRHSSVTTTREQIIKFDRGDPKFFWLMFQASSGGSGMSAPVLGLCRDFAFSITKMTSSELAKVYQGMISKSNQQKVKIGSSFSLK